MGWNFDEFFTNAGEKAQEALDDLIKVGKPMVEVAAAEWGQDLLKQMQQESQKDLNAAVKDMQNNPSQPGTLGAAFKTTIQGTFLETYGLYIVIGVAALIVLGMFLRK